MNILIVYDTHEFGSSVANALERRHLTPPPALTECHMLFTWLAGGMCYKKNEAHRTAKALRDLGHAATVLDIKNLSLSGLRKDVLTYNRAPLDLARFDGAWLRLAGRKDKSQFLPRPAKEEYFRIASYIEESLPVVTPLHRSVQLDGKVETQWFLEERDIPAPRSLVLTTDERDTPGLEDKVTGFLDGYPDGSKFVLKKDRGSMGHGAPYRKHPRIWDDLQSEIRGIFIHDDHGLLKKKTMKWLQPGIHKGVLLQEFVKQAGAGERRIEVFVSPKGPEILYACERGPTSNISLDVISEEDKDVAFQVAQAAGNGRWGIDLIGTPPRVLELNPFSTMRSRFSREERLGRSEPFFRQIAQGIENVLRDIQPN